MFFSRAPHSLGRCIHTVPQCPIYRACLSETCRSAAPQPSLPCSFVFDGKPPQLKSDELSKRFSRKAEATEDLQIAKESGTAEEIEKFSKRTVRVSREQTAECKRLLTLMGVPVLDAPSEAEAQCAELAKKGIVYGVSTEDMDALTFGTPRLIRNLMVAASQNKPVLEIDLAKALEGLGLTQEQFVDLGILCGCDYTDKIAGIGPTRALQVSGDSSVGIVHVVWWVSWLLSNFLQSSLH